VSRRPSAESLTGVAWLAGLVVATPLTVWLFLTNPQSVGELGSRLALGLSPDRFSAEMFAGSELLERGGRFLHMEEPTDEAAALAQRELLRARGHFARAVERAGSAGEAARARSAWGQADLQLASWALRRGKGRGLRGDDEDLFRWGLAYAREGLGLDDLDPQTRAQLRKIEHELEEELSFWD
jgi:hypothetical protein